MQSILYCRKHISKWATPESSEAQSHPSLEFCYVSIGALASCRAISSSADEDGPTYIRTEYFTPYSLHKVRIDMMAA